MLANLYMHYAFDRWMVTQNPNNPWVRYADDAVIHCRTKEEAEDLLERLKARLTTCRLEVHPDKTRIVYCHSGANKERHDHESFDFLGYTFRCRWVKTKRGNFFLSFSAAASKAAVQGFKEKMRACRIAGKQMTPSQLAGLMNPIIRGWANYFMKYGSKEARNKALYYVNSLLVQWARKRYKRLSGSRGKAYKWLCEIAKVKPDLFFHWHLGLKPAMG